MCDNCDKSEVKDAYGCGPCDYDLCPECATKTENINNTFSHYLAKRMELEV
jgi:hypothetical protein